MPTPRRTTIEITDGKHTAKVVTDYRWWTSDPDPWKSPSIGLLAALGGSWYYLSTGTVKFFSEILDLYTGEENITEVLSLWGLPSYALGNPFIVGRGGLGRNKFSGGVIPVGTIHWRVTSIV